MGIGTDDLPGGFFEGSSGVITCTWSDGSRSSVRYRVDGPPGFWTLTLHYRWGDQEDIQIPIRVEAISTQFNGERNWFVCPLIIAGVACTRRVSKVYLPPGARYFGCRTCHRLTYRSSKTAHQMERAETDLMKFVRQIAGP